MANIKSQKKRIRQDKTKNIRNKAAKTSLKSSPNNVYIFSNPSFLILVFLTSFFDQRFLVLVF